jgi:rubrerythrin
MDTSRDSSTTAAGGEESQVLAAGNHVKGEFRCADCGHAVTVYRELQPCPMCGCESWHPAAWSPFARALDATISS